MDENFGAEMDTVQNAGKTTRRLLHTMAKQKVRLIIVFLSVVIYTATNIMAPLYSANVVDTIWNRIQAVRELGESFHITWAYGGKQLVTLTSIYLFSIVFYTLQNFLMASFAEKMNYQLRSAIAQKLHRLPLSFYDRHQVGEVMSRVTNDLDKVSEALQTGLVRLFTSIGTVVGSVIMMMRFSVLLTLVFLAFVAVSTGITYVISKRTLRYAMKRQEAVGKMNGLVEESYSGRMVIKAFHYEETSSGKIHATAEELARTSEKTDFLMNAVMPATRLVNRFGMVAIAMLGGNMLLTGQMSPGVFQAFFQYMNQAGDPIAEMAYMVSSLQSALASMERVYTLLDATEMEAEPGQPVLPAHADRVEGCVDFAHVQFGYTPDKLLMTDVNFRAEPGQKIAIVGSTGAGKTTLVNLLMRFYETNGGQILLDGVPTKDMTRSRLRSYFGMVLQDTWLFEGTIAENIAYGKPDATMDEIRAAAKAARADFFIRTLPDGYETVLTNDAENISIGQRQLLTIARVFLVNPAILILDEATSSVDTRTEIEIGKAMQALMHGRTSFVIAHRLSTIVDANTILLMQNGNIIEQGDHRSLLKKGGAYAELYNSQFA